MLSNTANFLLVLFWIAFAWYIIRHSWTRKRERIGITITYVVFFAMAHWLPALVLLFPWYDTPLFDIELNFIGFYYSMVAIVSFALGTVWLTKFLKSFHARLMQRSNKGVIAPTSSLSDLSRLPVIYVVIGIVSTVLIFPVIYNIPTLSAFGSGVSLLFQVGMFLLLWQGFQRRSVVQVVVVWVILLTWLILQVVISGFLGFAASFIIAILVFHLSLLDRPFRYTLPFLLFAYIAVSFFIGYWTIRSEIRGVLWYGTEPVTTSMRVNNVAILLEAFELFDVTNPEHLFPIDERLNMNHLTGRTVKRIELGVVDYSYGETFLQALTMVVPRVVWPEKPVSVGGQAIVRQYAGYGILSGSIAPGHLMEFYLNFGVLGVIFGFMLMGAVVGLLDEYCAQQLKIGNLFKFAIILVAALTLVSSVTNYFVTMVGATLSGSITVYIVNVFVRSLIFNNRPLKR